MQYRMNKYKLTPTQINELLKSADVGRFATISENGYPYVIAMHYVYFNNKIYLHGLSKGQKIDNLKLNPKVCFEVDDFLGLLTKDIKNACDTEAEYKSAVITGNATLLEDLDLKREVLAQIVNKYTPQFNEGDLPDNLIKSTAVIEIEIIECTGKYHN